MAGIGNEGDRMTKEAIDRLHRNDRDIERDRDLEIRVCFRGMSRHVVRHKVQTHRKQLRIRTTLLRSVVSIPVIVLVHEIRRYVFACNIFMLTSDVHDGSPLMAIMLSILSIKILSHYLVFVLVNVLLLFSSHGI